jgi:DNA primase
MAEANAFVDFKTVKEQAPIMEILKRYGLAEAFKKSGRQLIGQCPFHQGHKGTFKVDPDKESWYCFKCKEGGDTLTLVARFEECDIREAALKLVDWFNLNPGTPPGRPEPANNDESMPATVITENPPLPFELDLDPDHPWFERNGITAEAIAHFGLGYCQPETSGRLPGAVQPGVGTLQPSSRRYG